MGILSYPPGNVLPHSSSLEESLSSTLVRAHDAASIPASLIGIGVFEHAIVTVTVSVR